MITLDDVLRDLTYGEFAQLNLGNFLPEEHENEPDPRAYAQLCSWVNLGLKAIYSEFHLASEEIEIQLDDAIGTYVLSTDYTVTQGTKPTLYIIDSATVPFTDNILKIESVYDEEGNELPLNDPNYLDADGNPYSLYTPTYRELQVPSPSSANTIAVQFRAGHPKVEYTYGMDPTAIEIKIPHQLHEALLWYIASRAFASIGGDGGQEGNDYYRKYQARVESVGTQGLYIQNEPSNDRFGDNGWC